MDDGAAGGALRIGRRTNPQELMHPSFESLLIFAGTPIRRPAWLASRVWFTFVAVVRAICLFDSWYNARTVSKPYFNLGSLQKSQEH